MARRFSSALASPSSNASIASYSMAAGSVDPMRRIASVPAGTRWRSSHAVAVTMRRQSASGTMKRACPNGYLRGEEVSG
jgi:hypothetical protein